MAATTAAFNAEMALNLFRTMHRIRAFEQGAARLMAQGSLDGFLHVSIGQEAVAAGVCAALQDTDVMTTSHRGHGHCIAKGAKIPLMMAELFGRSGGYCGGRSGSMHIADAEVGILGANAIVGAGIPIALGGAFAAQVLKAGQVAVAFFGEGAVAEGVFHESLNIAALWRLPIVFVCENNQYAEMTPSTVHLSNTVVAEFARPYGLAATTVDGNDVVAVQEAAALAVARARGGDGATLLECVTYRWHGHFEGDPQKYRDKAEVARWIEADPIERLRRRVMESAPHFEPDLQKIQDQAVTEVADATAWAAALPCPDRSTLTQNVYAPARGGGR
jgi:TPP-dependent pyruvate/acetoin dehydrogenase alpha subunit